MSENPMFLYASEYESVEDAKADLEALKELHREHVVGAIRWLFVIPAALVLAVVVIALCVMVIYGLAKYSDHFEEA
jgi:hypothetical protein